MKRSKKLIVMLSVLAVLVLALLLQAKLFPKGDGILTDDEDSIFKVSDIAAESVKELSYVSEGTVLAFEKSDDGKWLLTGENSPEIDSELVESMANAITSAESEHVMGDISKEEISEYGLDEPALLVKISDGTGTYTYQFGSYNEFAEKYYLSNKDIPDVVYTVESSVYEAFGYTLEELVIKDTLPEIEADSILSISFGSVISKSETPTDENEEGKNYSAYITKDGAVSEYSYADFYMLCEEISEWNIDELVSLSSHSSFDILNPVEFTVKYTERQEIDAEGASGGYIDTEKSFTLLLGEKAEDGRFYCKTKAESPLVYKLSITDIEKYFN